MDSVTDTRKPEDLSIRPMVSSDLDSVIRIEKCSFPHPWTREQFIVELGREPYSRCHVAELKDSAAALEYCPSWKDAIVGFLMTWLVADELQITNLAVAPEVRRSGVAAVLLEYSLREAVDMGAAWCQLEVRVTNTPARDLYKRYGFKPLGTRKGYYQDGEDAVVMGKDL